jgi:hypothetical protein
MVGNGRYHSRLYAKDDEEYQDGLALQDLSCGQEWLQNCPTVCPNPCFSIVPVSIKKK